MQLSFYFSKRELNYRTIESIENIGDKNDPIHFIRLNGSDLYYGFEGIYISSCIGFSPKVGDEVVITTDVDSDYNIYLLKADSEEVKSLQFIH